MQSRGIKKQFEHEMTPWSLPVMQGGGYNISWKLIFSLPDGSGFADSLLGSVCCAMVGDNCNCPYAYKTCISTWTCP